MRRRLVVLFLVLLVALGLPGVGDAESFPRPTLPLAYTPPAGYAVDFVVLTIPGRTLRVYGDGVVLGYRIGNLAPWQDPLSPVTVERVDDKAPDLLSVEFALVELPPWCEPPPLGVHEWVCIDGKAVEVWRAYLPLVKNGYSY